MAAYPSRSVLHPRAAAACCAMMASAVPVELLDCSDLLSFGSESALPGSVMQEKVAQVWNSQDCAKGTVVLEQDGLWCQSFFSDLRVTVFSDSKEAF